MRRTENPENVVRFHETPHMVMIVQLVRTPDCGSGGREFDPSCSRYLIFIYLCTRKIEDSIHDTDQQHIQLSAQQ